jgi:hypothetical protein
MLPPSKKKNNNNNPNYFLFFKEKGGWRRGGHPANGQRVVWPPPLAISRGGQTAPMLVGSGSATLSIFFGYLGVVLATLCYIPPLSLSLSLSLSLFWNL